MKEIRKQLLIDAPVETVWAQITDPGRIASWFLPNDFTPEVGRRFTLDCNVSGRIECEVVELDPPRRLAYTFKPASLPFATTVAFSLEPLAARKTQLSLVHSGWDALAPEHVDVLASFERGWQSRFLAQLSQQFPMNA